jgi:FMN phosphatase YigB (HAD superfamily)
VLKAGVLFDLDETLIDRRTWFVGDDPTADVWGAKQVGLSAAWIPRHVAWPDDLPMCQDARLSDASEVLALL